MKSLYSATYQTKDYEPAVYAYYDRADMLHSTQNPVCHAHALCEIMYVSEGSAQVQVGDHCAALGRRQYIWLDASVPHELILPARGTVSMMNIEYRYQPATGRCPTSRALYAHDPAFAAMVDEGAPYLLLTDTNDDAFTILKQIIRLADSMGEAASSLCSFLVIQLMLLIAAQWEEQRVQPCQPVANRYVSQALSYLQDNYAEPITIQSLAAALDVQPGYLQRLFKKHTQRTLIEHLHRIRMERAKELLLQTDYTILDIAVSVGISSQQYFTQLFRRTESRSPTEFRRQGAKDKRPAPRRHS